MVNFVLFFTHNYNVFTSIKFEYKWFVTEGFVISHSPNALTSYSTEEINNSTNNQEHNTFTYEIDIIYS